MPPGHRASSTTRETDVVTCTISECEKPAGKRSGWCVMHYARWQRHGDPSITKRPTYSPRLSDTCTIDDCDEPHMARGWCMTHYYRWRRQGSPLVVGMGGAPRERNASWTGDEATYHAVHKRLAAERGAASDYTCELCDNEAEEWAFDEPTGYSTDLSRYRPLCVPCHRRADRSR